MAILILWYSYPNFTYPTTDYRIGVTALEECGIKSIVLQSVTLGFNKMIYLLFMDNFPLQKIKFYKDKNLWTLCILTFNKYWKVQSFRINWDWNFDLLKVYSRYFVIKISRWNIGSHKCRTHHICRGTIDNCLPWFGLIWFGLIWFYDILTNVGHSTPNPFFTYK